MIGGKLGSVLVNSDGHAWTADGFRSSPRKACAASGIAGVTFNDLRGTAVARLALAGFTEAEIARLTGHSVRDVRSILDSRYLNRDRRLANPRSGRSRSERKFPTRRPPVSGCSLQPKNKMQGNQVAGEPGFEPRLAESESAVLPLNYSPPGLVHAFSNSARDGRCDANRSAARQEIGGLAGEVKPRSKPAVDGISRCGRTMRLGRLAAARPLEDRVSRARSPAPKRLARLPASATASRGASFPGRAAPRT